MLLGLRADGVEGRGRRTDGDGDAAKLKGLLRRAAAGVAHSISGPTSQILIFVGTGPKPYFLEAIHEDMMPRCQGEPIAIVAL